MLFLLVEILAASSLRTVGFSTSREIAKRPRRAAARSTGANAVMIAIASGPADFGVAVFDRRDVKHE